MIGDTVFAFYRSKDKDCELRGFVYSDGEHGFCNIMTAPTRNGFSFYSSVNPAFYRITTCAIHLVERV